MGQKEEKYKTKKSNRTIARQTNEKEEIQQKSGIKLKGFQTRGGGETSETPGLPSRANVGEREFLQAAYL